MKFYSSSFENTMHELESHPEDLRVIAGKKDLKDRILFLCGFRLWQLSGRPDHEQWQEMSGSPALEAKTQELLEDGGKKVLSYFGMDSDVNNSEVHKPELSNMDGSVLI